MGKGKCRLKEKAASRGEGDNKISELRKEARKKRKT